jgi:hypothetical protein
LRKIRKTPAKGEFILAGASVFLQKPAIFETDVL